MASEAAKIKARDVLATANDAKSEWGYDRNQALLGLIADAIDAASKAPKGCVVDDEGVARKLMGTLPVTADDVVCGIGSIVYTKQGAAWQACVHNAAHVPSQCEGGDPSIPLHHCYSTPEAAEAARGGAA